MAQQRSRRRSSGDGGGKNAPARRRRTGHRPTDHREVEWQFDAADLDPVEAWLRQHSSGSGLAVEPESDEEVADTYYDSDDWRFYRAGYALRVRKDGGGVEATMKSISGDPGEGNVRRRREISEPLTDREPSTLGKASGPVGERARPLLGGRELGPMFEVRTRRRTFAVLLEAPVPPENGVSDKGDGVRIGAVMLDESEVPIGGGKEAARLRRVEVEADAGAAPSPALSGLVDEMQYALDLEPAPASKFETGLYATGLSPQASTDAGPTEIHPAMTLGEVAFAVLRRQFAALRAHEPGTRIGEDPEELHDMRVATRRMRAAMKVFGGALPERARWLREELRWLAHALGDVRDLDVQIGRIEGWRDEASEDEFLGKILEVFEKRRRETRGRMLRALDSARYERLESSLAEMLRRGPGAERELAWRDGDGPVGRPVTSEAPALISARYRKWRKAAKRLDGSSPPEAFHDLRKKGKKLRYALEFVSEVYGEPVRDAIKSLKTVQDELGDYQDAVVLAEALRELGATAGGPRLPRGAVFTTGAYHERCLKEAAGFRSAALGSKSFRSLVKGKGWKGFEKAAKAARR